MNGRQLKPHDPKLNSKALEGTEGDSALGEVGLVGVAQKIVGNVVGKYCRRMLSNKIYYFGKLGNVKIKNRKMFMEDGDKERMLDPFCKYSIKHWTNH